MHFCFLYSKSSKKMLKYKCLIKIMAKSFQKPLVYLLLAQALLLPSAAMAQEFSVLPKARAQTTSCTKIIRDFHDTYISNDPNQTQFKYNTYGRFQKVAETIIQKHGSTNGTVQTASGEDMSSKQKVNEILGCGIVTGRIRLYFWKPFVVYIIKNLSLLASVLAMLFISIGGYQYFMAVITGEDSNAKNTIKHAIIGLVLALSSWIIVDLVQTLVSV